MKPIRIFAYGDKSCGICIPEIKAVWFWYLGKLPDNELCRFRYFLIDQVPEADYNLSLVEEEYGKGNKVVIIVEWEDKSVDVYSGNSVGTMMEDLDAKYSS
jgi:hypothetical protein